MRKGSVFALIVTGVIILAVAAGTSALSFFMWALALNGFMGQEQAVNASLIVLVLLVTLTSLASIALGLFLVHHLSNRRNWNAAGASVLSTTIFSIGVIALQILSVFISVAIASLLRTTR